MEASVELARREELAMQGTQESMLMEGTESLTTLQMDQRHH